MDENLFNASISEGVVVGNCVVLVDSDIFYAGPIKTAPDMAGKLVVLNPVDFEKLKTVVNRHKN